MLSSTRRECLTGVAALALVTAAPKALALGRSLLPPAAMPVPLTSVRLLPSDYATAVEVNRAWLHSLSADRLLSQFRKYAGLEPKAPPYGGWESETIAGHTLGHYLSALALMHEQTGDTECRARSAYIVGELAAIQARRGDGYIGALQRKRPDGSIVDGQEIFPEVMRGDIRAGPFDLNGAWSPLYNVHKTFAGLLDAHRVFGDKQALAVAVRLAGYFETVFAALDAAQMELMLACEYGGLNESFAELSARTHDPRWLALARRIYDHKMLDPLARGEDRLAYFHANTQVPKLIGLAKIHELDGGAATRAAAETFWAAVIRHHSYVIGGNSDREYFSPPDTIARNITEQTCEHCNTYNMLKLTRQLYGWQPDASYFDYYERAHLNHVMAAQNRRTGGFTYMTPLMSGAPREYSKPGEDVFWCCVGTGMESHSKHGDSIFWEGGDTVFVNLYIPAELRWARTGGVIQLETGYPIDGDVRLTLSDFPESKHFRLALRIPSWVDAAPAITVNDRRVKFAREKGYAIVDRAWRSGDRLDLKFPVGLRVEQAPGDPATVSVLHGPMVLAADLGPTTEPDRGIDPAMVGDDLLSHFQPAGLARYRTAGLIRPADLAFAPFYAQADRRHAVYFRRFTEAGWRAEQAARASARAEEADLKRRSIDLVALGDEQDEKTHGLRSEISYPVSYRRRTGRDARSGGFVEFTMKAVPGPLVLQASYWGDENPRAFDILVDGQRLATQRLGHDRPGTFFTVDYPVPPALTDGKQTVAIKFLPHDRNTAGPVFGVRLLRA
jgi:DUF1680 family protein